MMRLALHAMQVQEARRHASRAQDDARSAPAWALLVRYGTANQVAHAPGMIRRYGPLVDAGPGWLAFERRYGFGRIVIPCP